MANVTTEEDATQAQQPEEVVRPSFRAALASRDFSLLFIGQLGSEIGNGLVQLALPLLVFQLTGSGLQLGIAYFFQFSPMLLFGILGGVLVDRWDRRLTIVVVDVIRAGAFISIGVVYYLDSLPLPYLYGVIFLESALANLFNPARAALMPNLVQPQHLRPANSLMEISRYIGFLIAPPVGAVLSEYLGPAALMLFDGFTFLLMAVMVFFIAWRPPPREIQRAENWRHSAQMVLDQTFEGLATIRKARLLQVSLLLGFSLNLIVAPIQVLLPLFVFNIKHESDPYYGLLVAGLLTGLIAGSLLAPYLSRRIGLGHLAIVAVVVLGIVVSIAAWPPTIWPPLIAMLFAGTAIGCLNVAQTTMLQGATTDEERGRVSAAYFTFTLGVRPIGFLVVGALADSIDLRVIFVVLGILALGVGGILARIPEVRETH